MPDSYAWIETDGGPFLMIAEETLPAWRGTEGWAAETHGEDGSDYSRACDVVDWIGKIQCGESEAYILGGDVGPISWIASEGSEGGFLVQWIAVDDEDLIVPALQSKEFAQLVTGENAEHTDIEIAEPGRMRIIQAAEIGDDVRSPSLTVLVRPGIYHATSVYLETTALMIVVRKLEFANSLPQLVEGNL